MTQKHEPARYVMQKFLVGWVMEIPQRSIVNTKAVTPQLEHDINLIMTEEVLSSVRIVLNILQTGDSTGYNFAHHTNTRCCL